MIQIKKINFSYEGIKVLGSISAAFKEREFAAIIGRNGSGKTTLAKHLNGLLVPDKGSVIVDNFSTKSNDKEVKRLVGFVFQNPEDQLIHSIVEEDIAFGLENLSIPQKDMHLKVDEVLKRLGIENLRKRNVNALSLGQKQLVALAGILVMKPKYIVFDEPFTFLDPVNKKNIVNIMLELNKKDRIGIIIVTNSFEDFKLPLDKVIIIQDGSIVFDGKKKDITKSILKRADLYVQ